MSLIWFNPYKFTTQVVDNTPLYAFDSFTFTNAGATFQNGPTLAQLQSTYSSVSWASNSDYFSLYNSIQGYQLWTVPETAHYLFLVVGARGGSNGSRGGGRGSCVITKLYLQKGNKLIIIAGQIGGSGPNTSTSAAGGGGGSFVIDSANTSYPLIAASGGGGTGNNSPNQYGRPYFVEHFIYGDVPDLTSNTSSVSAAGLNQASELTAGAGYLVNTANTSSFTDGFIGGSLGAAVGGFGGGGPASFNTTNMSGGGGGGWIGGRTQNNSGGDTGRCFCINSESGVLSNSCSSGFVYIKKYTISTGMTNITFTSLGKYGNTGPTFAEQFAAYTVSYQKNYIDSIFPSLYQAGFQSWIVPQTGTYRIEVTGANGESNPGATGGRGAIVSSTFSLEYGDLLMIIVGQCRTITNTGNGGGGGGATWVAKLNSSNILMSANYYINGQGTQLGISKPLIGAGGGGGAYTNTTTGISYNGKDASVIQTSPTQESRTLGYQSGAAFMGNNYRSNGLNSTSGSNVSIGFSLGGVFGGGGRYNTAAGGGGAGWTAGYESTTGGNAGSSYCLNPTYVFDSNILNSRSDKNGAVFIELIS